MSQTTVEQQYQSYTWSDNPNTEAGRKYFSRTQSEIKTLLKSGHLKKSIEQDRPLKILELMAGAGYGGIALARELDDMDISYELHLTDIREDVLGTAETFAATIKGQPYVYSCDVRTLADLQWQYDIVLIYGLSLPHLNPWEWMRFCQRIRDYLTDEGTLIVHETDRRLFDFIQQPYQKVAYAGKRDNKDIIHMHEGYNLFKGTIKRRYAELGTDRQATNEAYYWGLAEVGAMMSATFGKISYQHVGNYRYFITGQYPLRNT